MTGNTMDRCPECDSEISPNATFCSSCGTGLQPADDKSSASDDSLESTIMMSREETETAAAESSSIEPKAEPEPTDADIPTPAILASLEGPTEVPRSGGDSSTDIPMMDDGENETPAASESSGSPDEKEAEFSITRPADELELPESGPAMFDSVRIIEPKLAQEDVATRIRRNEILTPAEISSSDVGGKTDTDSAVNQSTAPGMGVNDTDGRRSGKLKPLAEGTLLNGRYEIVRKIGGGGMGAVYLASDNNLGGVLRAVKEMVQAHIEEEQQEKAIRDFKRESMILSTLDHASIPTIYDYFYDEVESRFYHEKKKKTGGDL
jgi:hypothetical protein